MGRFRDWIAVMGQVLLLIVATPFLLCFRCLQNLCQTCRQSRENRRPLVTSTVPNYETFDTIRRFETDELVDFEDEPGDHSADRDPLLHQASTIIGPTRRAREVYSRQSRERQGPYPTELLLDEAIQTIVAGRNSASLDIYAEIVAAHLLDSLFDSAGFGLVQSTPMPSEPLSNSPGRPTVENPQASASVLPRQQPECSICLVNPKDRLMVPCGHCFCEECSKRIETCAICRRPILQKSPIRSINLDAELCAAGMMNALSVSPSHHLMDDISNRREANESDTEAGPDPECCDCYRRPKSIILIPCGHSFCLSCSDGMQFVCVICKQPITNRNVMHFNV